ncbi:dihydrofolate reductase [Paramormyrops kingsleyae]|uniref:dihydrofolate reductase n=1 Tax=Paramormyrops kingsleyae TaxID=1676925 RepID=UPI003B97751A
MFASQEKVQGRPIRLIAAACKNMGIGKNGWLPWTLPMEFQYLLDKISSVSRPGKKNLLVWGRICWFSAPENLHPIDNAVNVVLSRTISTLPKHAHYLCNNFESAVLLATSPPLNEVVETIWILGGVEIYKKALAHPWCDLIYLTDIMANFDCDTFFPGFDRNVYRLQDHFPGVPDECQQECGIRYKFQVFKKELGYRSKQEVNSNGLQTSVQPEDHGEKTINDTNVI